MRQDSSLQNSVRLGKSHYLYFPNLKLGEGYAGTIYQGVNTMSKQKIAVKIMNSGESIQKFIKSQTLIKITNQREQFQSNKNNGLVQVLQVINLNRQYIIMNLCQQSFRNFLNKNRQQFSEQFLLNFTKQISSGLKILNQNGYIHRDLKPQNILLSFQKQFKVADLDSIISIREQQSKFNIQIFGTIEYMAPEVLEMGIYSEEGTIWSLGMILHEMIYKRLPTSKNTYQNQTLGKTYNNLFALQIGKLKRSKMPLIHKLMEEMLHLNEKKRIDLANILKAIKDNKFVSNKIVKVSQKQKQNVLQQTSSSLTQSLSQSSVSQDQKQKQKCAQVLQQVPNNTATLLCDLFQTLKKNLQSLGTLLLKKKSLKLLNAIIVQQNELKNSQTTKDRIIFQNMPILKEEANAFISFIKRMTIHVKTANELQLFRKQLFILKMLQTLKSVMNVSEQNQNCSKIIEQFFNCPQNKKHINNQK